MTVAGYRMTIISLWGLTFCFWGFILLYAVDCDFLLRTVCAPGFFMYIHVLHVIPGKYIGSDIPCVLTVCLLELAIANAIFLSFRTQSDKWSRYFGRLRVPLLCYVVFSISSLFFSYNMTFGLFEWGSFETASFSDGKHLDNFKGFEFSMEILLSIVLVCLARYFIKCLERRMASRMRTPNRE